MHNLKLKLRKMQDFFQSDSKAKLVFMWHISKTALYKSGQVGFLLRLTIHHKASIYQIRAQIF